MGKPAGTGMRPLPEQRMVIAPAAARLFSARAELDDRVGSRADIVGSMVGIKIRAGRVTNQLSLSFFVREKVDKADLHPKERIPSRLRLGTTTVATDVLVWPRMVEQATRPSLPPASIISDGRTQGVLTCFGESSFGRFGVSCAHCLVGTDRNPATPSPVALYDPIDRQLVQVGESLFLPFSPGPGLPGNFGYMDCGLFGLNDASLAARAAAARPLPVVSDVRALIGQCLYGLSPLNAPGQSGPQRVAKVIGAESVALGERSDLVLQVESPGTFHGDSGMLWLTQSGQAAAIHARGQEMVGMNGSPLTTAMSAARASKALAVNLLLG